METTEVETVASEQHNLPKPKRRLHTVRQTAEASKQFTEASIRDLIFKSEPRYNTRGELLPGNGLAPAIFRVGARVLIDWDLFEAWLESFQGAPTKRRNAGGQQQAAA